MKYLYLLTLLMLVTVGCCPEEEPAEFHKYDLNQDGVVTPLDASLVINYLNEQQTNE